jgi:hypothetical protein
MKHSGAGQSGESASELISKRIAELGDWRGETLGRVRELIKEADPDVVEEWKWMGTPVWSHDGILCTGESYKKVVKLTFAKGAFLDDPARLFNSSLEGNMRRAIDIPENDAINEPALKALIRAAITLNQSGKKLTAAKRGAAAAASPAGKKAVPGKGAAAVKKAAPAKGAVAATKAAPGKGAVAAKKAAPGKGEAAAKKAAPAKGAVKKAAPGKGAVKKAAPAKKVAPATRRGR